MSADNTYPDTLGQEKPLISIYYMGVMSGYIQYPGVPSPPYTSCNLWVNNQAMYDSSGCEWWNPYQNNTQQYTIYRSSVWVTRDTEPGEII